MNKVLFEELAAAGYTHIPVTRTVMADFDTPLSAYSKLASRPYTYLLESAAQGGDQWNRFSFIGLPSRTVVKVRGKEVTVETDGKVVESTACDDPLDFIESYHARFNVPRLEDEPRFIGGLVGYFGYDTVRYVESKLAGNEPPDTLNTPDILLMVSQDLVIFDNVSSRIQIVTLAETSAPNAWEAAQARLQRFTSSLQEPSVPVPTPHETYGIDETDFESEFGREKFMKSVETIRDYIKAGDVMQVVIAQRLKTRFELPPIQLYRGLRSLNPSPYMYFMDLDDFHIIASTPEILARVEDGRVVNRPLAGTRRRGHDPQEDQALEKELLDDPKEIAEHTMLIDLGRNDLGRVAKIGSVKVTEKFQIERYSHVMHISSNVEAELDDERNAMDVLRATLPVGTLSGAPKIRAMEIIDELEPVKRGVYGGAVGYLSWNGNMDTAIAIRTAVVKDDMLYIGAGGGIVADSVPRLEWKESMNKARAIFRAANLAARGFQENSA